MKEGGISLEKARFLDPKTIEKWQEVYKLQSGDILINSTGTGTVCRTRVFNESCLGRYPFTVPDSHVTVVRTFNAINSFFVFAFVESVETQKYLEENLSGSTNQKELYIGVLENLLIPIPPAKEQENMVNEIASLFAKLETISISRRYYKRILSETPTSLRQQLIQSAIQGQLLPQNPNDEPASVLLERIAEERASKMGKKAVKSMSRIERRGSKTHATYHEIFPDGSEKDISEEIPFDVPDGWEWVRAGAIFDIWSAKRVLQADWQTAGIPFYRAREIAKLAEFGQVNNDLFITEELFQRLAIGGLPHTGDLMITAVGTIGKVYIVKQEDRFYFKDASVISFRNSGGLNSSFLKKLLESDCLQKQMYNKSVGTTVDTITIAKANEYLLPIPPLAEQNRISERLENLLSKIE